MQLQPTSTDGHEASGTGSAQNTAVLWGTDIRMAHTIEQFTDFFETFHDGASDTPKYKRLLEQVPMMSINMHKLG